MANRRDEDSDDIAIVSGSLGRAARMIVHAWNPFVATDSAIMLRQIVPCLKRQHKVDCRKFAVA